jgi:RND superfamily putative drug exporter
VTSAAVVMVTVFASFVPLHLIEMKQIGFSLAAGVLLDAFVIRLLILPAIMLLLGDRVWWPSRRPGIPTADLVTIAPTATDGATADGAAEGRPQTVR